MTNYEWLKERILKEVDTPEKMEDSILLTALNFGKIADDINAKFCKPSKGAQCVYWKKYGCSDCVRVWLAAEHK